MNERTLMILAGLLLMVSGYAMHNYARWRFRTASAPGLGPRVRPSEWRTRREWFSTEHGYRLSRRGGLLISLGGLVSLIGSFF